MKEIRLCDNSELEKTVELCKKAKVGIEVQSFYNPYIDNLQQLVCHHNQILSEINCGKSLHAPFWDLNLGTKIKELREAMMNMYNQAYTIAKELGCTEMVIHSNYKPGTDWYEGWIKRAKSFLQEFLKEKDNAITICIENQFESDSELLIMLIDEISDPRVKLCLDVGHVNANSNMPIEEWIKTLNNRIEYYHLHNNYGKKTIYGYNKDDEHLGINHGTLEFSKVLELAEEYSPNAIWNFESKTRYHEEDLETIKKLGYLK